MNENMKFFLFYFGVAVFLTLGALCFAIPLQILPDMVAAREAKAMSQTCDQKNAGWHLANLQK